MFQSDSVKDHATSCGDSGDWAGTGEAPGRPEVPWSLGELGTGCWAQGAGGKMRPRQTGLAEPSMGGAQGPRGASLDSGVPKSLGHRVKERLLRPLVASPGQCMPQLGASHLHPHPQVQPNPGAGGTSTEQCFPRQAKAQRPESARVPEPSSRPRSLSLSPCSSTGTMKAISPARSHPASRQPRGFPSAPGLAWPSLSAPGQAHP